MAIDLIIVDDHELVASGIANLFKENSKVNVLCTFSSPKTALENMALLKPQIVISDLDMPKMNGLEMIGIAKEKHPETKFVLLTMHLSKQIYQKAKQLGVQGYLPKTTDEDELMMCLDQLIKGKSYYSQKLMELLATESLPNTAGAAVLKLTQMLSDREREILVLVAEGYSSKEIGAQLYLAPKTIETHRKNIMSKLDVQNVAGMVRIAVKEGLLN